MSDPGLKFEPEIVQIRSHSMEDGNVKDQLKNLNHRTPVLLVSSLKRYQCTGRARKKEVSDC